MIHNRIALGWCLLLGLMLAVLTAAGAAAQTASGSLTLQCHIGTGNTRRPLAGDHYVLVPVADLVVDEENRTISYTTRPEFAAFDCDWAGLTASGLNETAIKMASTALKWTDGCPAGVTDAEGTLTLWNLDPCLYLVLRTEVAAINSDTLMDPFLVSVPAQEDGVLYNSVTTTPKFAVEETPPHSVPPASGPSPEKTAGVPTAVPLPEAVPTAPLPQTGQLNWPVPVLLVAGTALCIVGCALRRRQEKTDHEA